MEELLGVPFTPLEEGGWWSRTSFLTPFNYNIFNYELIKSVGLHENYLVLIGLYSLHVLVYLL
jgi:hypothetical protein